MTHPGLILPFASMVMMDLGSVFFALSFLHFSFLFWFSLAFFIFIFRSCSLLSSPCRLSLCGTVVTIAVLAMVACISLQIFASILCSSSSSSCCFFHRKSLLLTLVFPFGMFVLQSELYLRHLLLASASSSGPL